MNKVSNWLKKYFVPHHENDHKPHFLRHESMALFFLLIVMVEVGFLVQVFVVYNKTDFLATVLPGVLANITNDERKENSVPPLTENALLDKAAQLKAEDMAKVGYFAHTSPEGKTPWYWFDQVGYQYIYAGENLAVNFFESEDVAKAWMNSPTHRANIVKADYTEIGFGVAHGMYQGKSTVFVAQLFGTPLNTYQKTESETKSAPVYATTTPTYTPTTNTKTTVPKTQPAPKTKVTKTEAPVITRTNVARVPAPDVTQVLGEENRAQSGAIASINRTVSYIKTFIQKALSSPREYAGYIYGVLFAIIAIAIGLAMFIKSELGHPKIIARGVGAMAVIVFLLFLNLEVVSRSASHTTRIPSEELSASVDLSSIGSVAY